MVFGASVPGLWLLLQLLPVVTIPVFFYVFAEGSVWSPSAFFCYWTVHWLFFRFGLYLYGGFWTSRYGCVCVIVIVIIGRDLANLFLSQRDLPTFSLLQVMRHLLKVGVFFLEFLLVKVFDFPSQLGLWKLLWVTSPKLGFTVILALNLLMGAILIPLSVTLLPSIGVGVWLWGSELVTWGFGI